MKTNVKNFSKNRGITLIEITLVIALILGLTAVGTFGMAAYKKGSNAANCLTQQHRILKTTVGSLMHLIDNADEVGTNAQRNTIINEFYTSISTTAKIANQTKCPSYNSNPSRGDIVKHIFGTENETLIKSWYGRTVNEILTQWFWFETPEEGLDYFKDSIGAYSLGCYITYDGNTGYSYTKQYGALHKQISKSAYVYVMCQRSWGSYSSAKNPQSKIEYHTNW